MESSKAAGAKEAVSTMMFYYLSSLIGTQEDPKQYIAGELGNMIGLTEDQIAYVRSTINTDNKIISSLQTSIDLLNNMLESKKIDIDSMNIVIEIMKTLKAECTKAITKYIGEESDDMEES